MGCNIEKIIGNTNLCHSRPAPEAGLVAPRRSENPLDSRNTKAPISTIEPTIKIPFTEFLAI